MEKERKSYRQVLVKDCVKPIRGSECCCCCSLYTNVLKDVGGKRMGALFCFTYYRCLSAHSWELQLLYGTKEHIPSHNHEMYCLWGKTGIYCKKEEHVRAVILRSFLSLSVSISLIQNNWWNKHWIPYAPSQSVLLLYLCVGFTIVLWMGVRAFVMCEDGTRFHCLELCCCYLMFLSRNGPTSPWISKMNQPGFICTCALATIPKCAPKWNSQVHGDRINYIGIPHIIFFSSTRVFLLQFYQILYILTSYSNIIRVVITIYSCQQSWATSTIDLLLIPLMIVNLTGNLKLILTHSNVRLNQ